MPRATAVHDTERFELRSLEDAWIEVRRLAYGEILRRRELASSMSGRGGQRRRSESDGAGNDEVKVRVHFTAMQQYDFKHCIIDHNLEDENGNKLNLADVNHLTKLDPKVGQEIEEILDNLNNPDEDEESLKSVAGV